MRGLVSLVFVIGLVATTAGQACGDHATPPPVTPDCSPSEVSGTPLPDKVSGMNKASAQVVVDKGEVYLIVLDNRPMETVYVVREPSAELRDDGQGEKTEAKRFTPEVRIRTCVSLEPALPRRYRVSGNKALAVMDGTGKTLTDKEVIKALEKPAVVYEVNDKPDPELLATPLHPPMILQPDAVLLVWENDAARSASELPAIAEQRNAADSR